MVAVPYPVSFCDYGRGVEALSNQTTIILVAVGETFTPFPWMPADLPPLPCWNALLIKPYST